MMTEVVAEAGKIEWKDATSYSRGQRGCIPPNSWECHIGTVRVWLSCGHHYYPETWVVSCHSLGIETKELGTSSLIEAEQARHLAIRVVAAAAEKFARQMSAVAEAARAALKRGEG